MTTLFSDLRYSARGLIRSPGFALAAILTLTLGIAANTTLFSLVDSFLWRPYPYPESDRLVVVQGAAGEQGLRWGNLSLPDAQDFAEQSTLLQAFAVWDWEPYGLSGDAEPVRVGGTRVSAQFFDALGVKPIAGRTFREGEEGPSSERLVVLSEGLWRSYFGGDEDIVGKSVLINAHPTVVIGVMPAGSEYPDQTELWVPIDFDTAQAPRGANFLGSIARIREGVALSAVEAEIESIGQRLAVEYADASADRIYRATPLREILSADSEPIGLALLATVTFLLLIVCANVANLLLARSASREQEVAVRRALGASSGRLVQLLFSEAFLLSLVSGVLGFGLGWLATNQITERIPNLPPWIQTSMNPRIVFYTVAASLAAGVLSSLLPLFHNLTSSVATALNRGGPRQSADSGSGRLRGSLAVSEVALSLILLVGAGLTVKSLLSVAAVDPGFSTDNNLTIGLDLLTQRDAPAAERAQSFAAYLDAFAEVPGIEAVGAINLFPLKRRSNSVGVSIEGQSDDDARLNPSPQLSAVTPGYFDAMGIAMLRGSDFPSLLGDGGPAEAIVSTSLAAALWPDKPAVGQRLRLGADDDDEWFTVRAVAADIHHSGLDREKQSHLYLPYHRTAPSRMTVIVRHQRGLDVTPLMRQAASSVDPNQPLHEVMSVKQVVDASMWQWRFLTGLAWSLGTAALLLAVCGLYAVMSYTVSQRKSEVGVRVALGAAPGQVVGMVLRQGGLLMAIGLGIGLLGSLGVAKALAGFLFAVEPFEPWALAAAVALLGFVALPALLVPAFRAAGSDPIRSLRAD